MAGPDRIEGLAIVSADGMIADARGIQPDALKLEADHISLAHSIILCQGAKEDPIATTRLKNTLGTAFAHPPSDKFGQVQRSVITAPKFLRAFILNEVHALRRGSES